MMGDNGIRRWAGNFRPAPTPGRPTILIYMENDTGYPKDVGRHSIRMKGYDYRQRGLYFVTICVNKRLCLFGKIADGIMALNDAGLMVEYWFAETANHFPTVCPLHMVVMPNHIHAIWLLDTTHLSPDSKAPTLGDVVGWFKTRTAYHYGQGVRYHNWPAYDARLWQRNYFESIISSEEDYRNKIWYIKQNPACWTEDDLYNVGW